MVLLGCLKFMDEESEISGTYAHYKKGFSGFFKRHQFVFTLVPFQSMHFIGILGSLKDDFVSHLGEFATGSLSISINIIHKCSIFIHIFYFMNNKHSFL